MKKIFLTYNKKDKDPKYEYIKTFVISLLLIVFGTVTTIWIANKALEIIFSPLLLFIFPAIITAVVAGLLILVFGIAPFVTGLTSAIISLIALAGKNAISDKSRVVLNKTARMFLIVLMSVYLFILLTFLLFILYSHLNDM